jgi:hypothetical protein
MPLNLQDVFYRKPGNAHGPWRAAKGAPDGMSAAENEPFTRYASFPLLLCKKPPAALRMAFTYPLLGPPAGLD